jgi:hypothetical protein
MNDFLAGAACLSFLVIVLFFLRFWQRTRDSLFLFFAGGFSMFMVERIVRTQMPLESDWAPYVYLIRLSGFVLIVLGILGKNRHG